MELTCRLLREAVGQSCGGCILCLHMWGATLIKGVIASRVVLVLLLCVLRRLFPTVHGAAPGLRCCVTWACTEAYSISGLMERLS